jgi:LacI family gluconate utilization system Gnt-I transcriptional repressor
MQDVAARAGVSPMTVSRALKTPEKVAPETRAKVQAAVADLGYVPDRIAAGLSSRRSRLLAALVSTLASSIFASTVDGLRSAARAAGYEVLLGSTDYSLADEEALIGAVLSRRPDGIALTGSIHTEAVRRLLAHAATPVVETWDLPDEPMDMVVGFSNIAAGRAMTGQLMELGYRRIAFIGRASPSDIRGAKRLTGYRQALAERSLGPERVINIEATSPAFAEGAGGLDALLERYPDTDAVFCTSDAVAAGALLQCRRRGIPAPDGMAVAGFGDFDIAGDLALELTTVRIPGLAIGEHAARLLIERIEGRRVPSPIVDVGFEIVRRRSA